MKNKSIFIIIFMILSFLIIKSIFSYSNVLAASYKIGDVNNNGKIETQDYILVRQHIIGTKKLDSNQNKRADTNSDGKITSVDYIKIRQAIIYRTDITPTVTSSPKPTTTSTTKPTTSPKPTATANTPKDNIDAYFLNTYDQSGFSEIYKGNDAFIFKTSNGKYVLIDTGNKSSDIKGAIYKGLYNLQKKEKVTIDYMIISHMHNDHYGNAIEIINDSKFNIKKLIIKKESHSLEDESIITAAKKKNISVIEVDSLKEGAYYTLSDNIKMYLFNVKDVFLNNDSCVITDYSTSLSSSKNAGTFGKTKDNKYIYFEGKDYLTNGNKTKINTRSSLEEKLGTDYRINGRFYLTLVNDGEKRSVCSLNANSLAILFQIKTTKGNKYMYIPSDLENNGYNPLGEYDSTYKTTIHGYAPTYFYEYEKVDGVPRFVVQNNQLVKSTKVKMVKKASSYQTALNMKNKFSDLPGNITVYQSAHHGLNNYQEVVSLLKLNNKSVNVVTPVKGNPKTNKSFQTSVGYYNLRSTNVMFGGGSTKKGTKCTIKANGTTTCAYY